jgi:hypothetical protein
MLMPTRVSAWKLTSMSGLLMEPLLVSMQMQMREPVLSLKRAPKSTQEPSLRLLPQPQSRLRLQRHYPRRKQRAAVQRLASPTSYWQPQMRLPLFLHPLCYEQIGLSTRNSPRQSQRTCLRLRAPLICSRGINNGFSTYFC